MWMLFHVVLITIWILTKNIKVIFNYSTYNDKYYEYTTCSYPKLQKFA